MHLNHKIITAFTVFLLMGINSFCQLFDFSKASIYIVDSKNTEIQKPVQVLREEIMKRTGIELRFSKKNLPSRGPVIAIIPDAEFSKIATSWKAGLQAMPETGNEGFKLLLVKE